MFLDFLFIIPGDRMKPEIFSTLIQKISTTFKIKKRFNDVIWLQIFVIGNLVKQNVCNENIRTLLWFSSWEYQFSRFLMFCSLTLLSPIYNLQKHLTMRTVFRFLNMHSDFLFIIPKSITKLCKFCSWNQQILALFSIKNHKTVPWCNMTPNFCHRKPCPTNCLP